MTDMFRALRLDKTDSGQDCSFVEMGVDDLMAGDVLVRVLYSTLNYKDGLVLTGSAPVVRRWPMVPGIDFVGEVVSTDDDRFQSGDMVILNGWGVGESHYGGYAQYARVRGDWLIKLPSGLTPEQSMGLGTAGYTAMLCVMAIEGGVSAGDGDILVTGAAGGVGSVAVSLLSRLGYRVVAATGRVPEEDYLLEIGAAEVIDRATMSVPGKSLAAERWAGVIDVAGSHMLANALASLRYGGICVACGLAQGADLPSSVMPFILRGVTLCGIDSVMAPRSLREKAWSRLERDMDMDRLSTMIVHHPLTALPQLGAEIIEGKIRGRVVIDI